VEIKLANLKVSGIGAATSASDDPIAAAADTFLQRVHLLCVDELEVTVLAER
jgi:predicted ATPase